MDNQLLDYVVIALYFAVMIGAGYWGLRRARSAEDYLVAGRRLGPFMYIGCLSAVVLGGASTIGGVALGYENGISGMWLVFWIGMGVIALGILMSTRLSRLGVYTVSEMLENRYGAASRLISAVIIAAYALMIAVTSTIAIGTVFNVILPLSPSVAILIAGGVVALTVAYDLLTGALFVPIVGALFWRRATAAGALASMVSGSVVVVVFMIRDGLFANTPIICGGHWSASPSSWS